MEFASSFVRGSARLGEGLPLSPMGLPPFLQRKEEMGADYLREVPDYIRDKPPGYDPKVNAAPYLSLMERRPNGKCGTYACAERKLQL